MTKPEEFKDVMKILEFGAKKYSADGWLDPDGVGMDIKSQMGSMSRHLAKALYSQYPIDSESGFPHLLHLACRALMLHTRRSRGIYHPKDIIETWKDDWPEGWVL